MLNPKLVEKFGENSRLFFDEFINRIGEGNATKCTIPDSYTVRFGDVNVPAWVCIYCDDDDKDNLYWEIYGHCMDICDEIQSVESRLNKEDDTVVCISRSTDEEREGVDLWVI